MAAGGMAVVMVGGMAAATAAGGTAAAGIAGTAAGGMADIAGMRGIGTAAGGLLASARAGVGSDTGPGSAIERDDGARASCAEFSREPAHELDASGEFGDLDELVGLVGFVYSPWAANHARYPRFLELPGL